MVDAPAGKRNRCCSARNHLAMLKPIVELERRVAVSPEPHSVATDGTTMWVASRATRKIDEIDVKTWQKKGEIDPPGMPWGMTYDGGALVMTCGEPPDDNRFVRRYAEGRFEAGVPCPQDTGSHVAVHGDDVLLAQWYNQQLLRLDRAGRAVQAYTAPHGIAGVAVAGESAYLVTTDDEDQGDYWVTRVDLSDGTAVDVARIPFKARGLAWDGARFWTNHREADRTVAFRLPDEA